MNSHLVSLPVASCPIASAVQHRLWMPDPGQSPLVEWWRPLVTYARRLRADEFPWALYVEDFDFLGSVARDRLPTVSLYRHQAGGDELCIGADGLPLRFAWSSGGRSPGRFIECDLRGALWRAGLPDLLDTPWSGPSRPNEYDEPFESEPALDAGPEPVVGAPVRLLRRV